MKINLFIFSFFILLTCKSFSQDIMTLKTGEDLKVKVLEVTTTEVKYKKTDNINGPIFTSLKSEILIVRYENGSKDIFNNILPKEKKIIPKEKKNIQGKKVSFGIKGGLNYSSLTGKYSNNPYLRFHFGGFSEIKISPTVSLQPELQFSAQGYKSMIELRQNFDDPIVYSTDNIDLSYLNIPVLTKFNINSNVNFVVGPQIGFLVMAKSDNLGDVKQLYNTVDFGFDFGGGVSFDDLIIDLRYNMGLSDVPLNKILVYGSGTSSKNSVFQLSLGYKF